MDLKAHAFSSLNLARRLTTSMLDDFGPKSQWLKQSHPGTNHALWITGHLALADNLFASKFRPEVDHKPEGWEELFWFGSQVNDDTERYPEPDVVRQYFDGRREILISVLKELSDAELSQPAPPVEARSPIAGAPNIGQAFFFIAYHEGMHSGQLSVIRRGLGHQPLYGPQSAPASRTSGA